MARPVTLFTGRWADLPLSELAPKIADWGFDGFELARWGDHFEVDRAIAENGYCDGKRAFLERHGLGCWSLGAPLSIEWEDSGMEREYGAQDALAFVRRVDFAPSEVAFDAAMQRAGDR